MNRTALAVILISIIVIAGAAWLILSQSQNPFENQICDVKITDFNLGKYGGLEQLGQ